jgi:hypothetical protein
MTVWRFASSASMRHPGIGTVLAQLEPKSRSSFLNAIFKNSTDFYF